MAHHRRRQLYRGSEGHPDPQCVVLEPRRRDDVLHRLDVDIANKRVFVEVGEGVGVADGATVDSEGFLWAAHMFGSRVTRYDPAGASDRVVELPVPQVTCCGFGGADLTTLYITTASIGMDKAALAEPPLAGALFAYEAGVGGLPEPQFGG